MSTFTLDVSTLSGVNRTYVDTPVSDRGQTVQVEWVQKGANQDLRLHGYAIRGVPSEVLEQDIPNPTTTTTGSASYYGLGLYGVGLYGIGTGSGPFFILNISVLGGSPANSAIHIPIQDRGRSIQVEWVQSGGAQDLRLHGYAIRGAPAEVHSLELA